MRALVALILIAIAAGSLAWGQQSQGLVYQKPVTCASGFTSCGYLTYPGTTGIVIARQAYGGAITDSYGGVTWTLDANEPYTGMSVYRAYFATPNYPVGRNFTFPTGTYSAVLLSYPGQYDFVGGAEGDYAGNNADIAGGVCVQGQNCPYWWTYPRAGTAGELLISFADGNSSGPGIILPGPGYQIEACVGTTGQVCVGDMLMSVDGLEFGNMTVVGTDGRNTGGGSHWIMGLAAYKRR